MPRRKAPVAPETAQDRLRMAEAHYPHAEHLLQHHAAGWRPARGQGARGADVIFAGEPRVAVRVRSFENLLRHADSFTLRTKPDERPVVLGECRWYLYGWADVGWHHHQVPQLRAWVLVDLRAFNRVDPAPVDSHDNTDGTAFSAYALDDRYVMGAQLWVPAPRRPEGHPAFSDLPVGACYVCHQLIWKTDDLAHAVVAGEVKRQHREPCYSEDVPW